MCRLLVSVLKYYEMLSTTQDDRILVRRASDHIRGRLSYRQVRNYTISHLENSQSMGALKTVNDIDIYYQYADITVDTPGYWKLEAYNDFEHGDLVIVNGVPMRKYHHKQILKFDFSKFSDAFTDSVRMSLTNLLNEVFVTLFADNQPFISAITSGSFGAPMTYSLSVTADNENADKCIFIIEDSQLDIGLLIAVERNINRIFQIVSDYLGWNEEQIEESLRKQETEETAKEKKPFNVYEEAETTVKSKKLGFFSKIVNWFKSLFKKKNKLESETVPADVAEEPKTVPTEEEKESETVSTEKQKKKEERAAKKVARKEAREATKNAKKEEKLRKKLEKKSKKEEVVTEQEEALPEQSEEEVSENE